MYCKFGYKTADKLYASGVTLLILILLISVFVLPWTSDEGGLLLNTKVYALSHHFFDFQTGVAIIFRKPWYVLMYIISCFFGFGKYYLFRIPSFIFALLVLFVLNDLFAKMNLNKFAKFFGLSFIVLWMSHYGSNTCGISVRCETVYLFAICFSIYAAYESIQKHKYKFYMLSFFINAIAFSIHPNGLFAYFVNAITFIYITRKISYWQIFTIITAGILSLFLFYILFTFDKTLAETLHIFFKEPSFALLYPFYDEYIRYFSFFAYNFIFLPFILFSIIYFFIARKNDKAIFITFLFYCLIAGIAYLFFMPRKWDNYFVILMPFFTISLALFAHNYLSSLSKLGKLFIATMMISLSFGYLVNCAANSVLFQSLFKNIYITLQVKNAEYVRQFLRGKPVKLPLTSIWFPYLDGSNLIPSSSKKQVSYEILFYIRSIPKKAKLLRTVKFEKSYYNVFHLHDAQS
jgi:hypothetical protein